MVLTVKSCKIEPLISAYRDPFKLCFYCPATHVTLQVLQAKTVNKWYRGSHTVISVHRGRQSFFNVQWAGPVVHLLLLKSSRDTHVSFHSGKRDLSILTKKTLRSAKNSYLNRACRRNLHATHACDDIVVVVAADAVVVANVAVVDQNLHTTHVYDLPVVVVAVEQIKKCQHLKSFRWR